MPEVYLTHRRATFRVLDVLQSLKWQFYDKECSMASYVHLASLCQSLNTCTSIGSARLLRLRVRIPQGAQMLVSCDCCCQSEAYSTSRSLVQGRPTDCVFH